MYPEARLYKKIDEAKVQCNLCNHFCVIKEDQSGKCLMRKNIKGKLHALNFGYPIAQNIDPIEKKPLFHFLPGSNTYSIGTLGCNFFCKNCQNWELSQAQHVEKNIEAMSYVSPEKIIEEAVGSDCASISYTYNEPTVFFEYALEIMKLAHENGLKNIWVTNGFMTDEAIDTIIPYLDAVNIDLKSFDDDFYKDNCGAKLEPVLKNLRRLKAEQIHIEITTLMIPTASDSLEMITKLTNFIVEELDDDIPWHISKFSPHISWQLKELTPTGEDVIYEAYEIAKETGLKYVYVGNMPGDQKENTYCPKCNELAIRRFEFEVERFDSGGRCAYCDKSLDITE